MKKDINKESRKAQKENLELIEKEVEIKKKQIEIKKGELDYETAILRNEMSIDNQKMQLEKVIHLKSLLSSCVLDSGKAILPSEPYFQPILQGGRREIVLRKLMEIVKEL